MRFCNNIYCGNCVEINEVCSANLSKRNCIAYIKYTKEFRLKAKKVIVVKNLSI